MFLTNKVWPWTEKTIVFGLLLFCSNTGLSYVFKCPYSHTSEWKLRAAIICNGSTTTRYQCLYDELGQFKLLNQDFTEHCANQADFLRQGQKYVIASRRRGINCPSNTYQPFRFWSNSSDECEFVKSKCSGEGQIIYSNGSTDADTTCRCNYMNGYAFINDPSKKCYCLPSEEDCSCYLKNCKEEEKLSKDYVCVYKNGEKSKSICPPILSHGNRGEEKISQTSMNTELDKHNKVNLNWIAPTVLIIPTIICIVIIGTLLVIEKLPHCFVVQLSRPCIEKVQQDENCSVAIYWCKPEKQINGTKYEVTYTYDDWTTLKTLQVDGEKFEGRIQDVLPFKCYKFKVSYMWPYGKNEIKRVTSEEVILETTCLPPKKVQVVKDTDGTVRVLWGKPTKVFQDVRCKIVFTWGKSSADEIYTDSDTSECTIPNVIPFETYRFKVSYTSQNGNKENQGQESEEVILATDTPDLNIAANANNTEKCIELAWSAPENVNVRIKKYEVQYTIDQHKKNLLYVDPSELSLKILDIMPKSTYRFKARYVMHCGSHKEEIYSNHSNEVMFSSEEPAPPGKLESRCVNETIKLSWISPAETLFKTTGYKIHISTNVWKNKDELLLAENVLQHDIENISKSKIYRFKVFNCTSNGICSTPVEDLIYTEVCYKMDIPAKLEFSENLKSEESEEYKECRNKVVNTIEDVYQKELEKGVQTVKDVCFIKKDQPIARVNIVVVLISEGYNDEAKLKEIIEKPIKSGKLGDITVLPDEFSFTVCNKNMSEPQPSQAIRVVVENNCIVLLREKPTKTIFEKADYRIEYTSDEWLSKSIKDIPNDIFEYRIKDVLPLTKYKFRFFTLIRNQKSSKQVTEEEVTTGGPLPLYNLKVALGESGDSFELAWDKPVFPSEKNIESYMLIVNEKEYDMRISVNECNYTWSPRDQSNVYTFTVIANAVNGTQSRSEKAICIAVKPPQCPSNITVKNDAGIELIWDHPNFPEQHCIKHYTIYIKEDGEHPMKPVNVPSTRKTLLIDNLKPKHCYTFKVSTCSSDNFEGWASNPVKGQTGDPLPPKDLKVFQTADGFELVWSKPEFPVEQYIKKYIVLMSSGRRTESVFETEETRLFIKAKAGPKTVYKFQCKTYTTDGLESRPSKNTSCE